MSASNSATVVSGSAWDLVVALVTSAAIAVALVQGCRWALAIDVALVFAVAAFEVVVSAVVVTKIASS